MKLRSLRLRLALLFGLVVGVVIALASTALFAFQTMELRRHQAEELRSRFAVADTLLQYAYTPQKWPRTLEKLDDLAPAGGSMRIILETDDPRLRFGEPFPAGAERPIASSGFTKARDGDLVYLLLSKSYPAHGERPAARLTVAVDCAATADAEWAMGVAVLVISLLAIVIAAALGWWVAKRGLVPVDQMSLHASRLGAGNLALRLPVATLPPELAGLALTLNGALDRLQTSYVQLAAFNADVAHELRTPLGNLIGETQVALARPRSTQELEDVLQSNLEELNRLRTIINDMLFLARADQGAVAGNMLETSLAEETAKSAEFLDMIFEEAGVTLHIHGDACARVDRALFGRAITNLLDNAVQHGSGNNAVTVTIEEQGPMVCVGVRNRAAPIEPGRLARLFDRFYRIDPARRNSGESHGLGLAIVKAVATMHGGSVFARCDGDEVVIGFTVPAAGRDVAAAERPALDRLAKVRDNAA